MKGTSKLKEATMGQHKAAEEQPFVGMMFGGQLSEQSYAIYLHNQIIQYQVLESAAHEEGMLEELPDIARVPGMIKDFDELYDGETELPVLSTTKRFVEYIESLDKTDFLYTHKLMAHLYTRHMGDLMGGQMLAKRVPGSSAMYEFADPDALKAAIRAKLDDTMTPEVKFAYEIATRTFVEMLPYANVKTT